MEEKVQGFNTERHEDNPKEKLLHDGFIEEMSLRDMEFIVFGHSKSPNGSRPDDFLSEREQRIVVSTIQWLGSSVGEHFLRNKGYCHEDEFKPKEKLLSSKLACLEKQLAKIPRWIKAIFK